jgi:hypothetical protein
MMMMMMMMTMMMMMMTTVAAALSVYLGDPADASLDFPGGAGVLSLSRSGLTSSRRKSSDEVSTVGHMPLSLSLSRSLSSYLSRPPCVSICVGAISFRLARSLVLVSRGVDSQGGVRVSRFFREGLARTVEIPYSGRRNVYKTKSLRSQNSGTRLYLPPGGMSRARRERRGFVRSLLSVYHTLSSC